MTVTPIKIEPIAVPEGSGIDFGATVTGVDIENLSETWSANAKRARLTLEVPEKGRGQPLPSHTL